MSLTGARTALAAALSEVDGVQGYPYRPRTPRTGDAWPTLAVLERDRGLSFMTTWRVLVLLSGDEQQASEWMDANTSDLVDALDPVAFVDSIEPVALVVSGNDTPALQITLRRE